MSFAERIAHIEKSMDDVVSQRNHYAARTNSFAPHHQYHQQQQQQQQNSTKHVSFADPYNYSSAAAPSNEYYGSSSSAASSVGYLAAAADRSQAESSSSFLGPSAYSSAVPLSSSAAAALPPPPCPRCLQLEDLQQNLMTVESNYLNEIEHLKAMVAQVDDDRIALIQRSDSAVHELDATRTALLAKEATSSEWRQRAVEAEERAVVAERRVDECFYEASRRTAFLTTHLGLFVQYREMDCRSSLLSAEQMTRHSLKEQRTAALWATQAAHRLATLDQTLLGKDQTIQTLNEDLRDTQEELLAARMVRQEGRLASFSQSMATAAASNVAVMKRTNSLSALLQPHPLPSPKLVAAATSSRGTGEEGGGVHHCPRQRSDDHLQLVAVRDVVSTKLDLHQGVPNNAARTGSGPTTAAGALGHEASFGDLELPPSHPDDEEDLDKNDALIAAHRRAQQLQTQQQPPTAFIDDELLFDFDYEATPLRGAGDKTEHQSSHEQSKPHHHHQLPSSSSSTTATTAQLQQEIRKLEFRVRELEASNRQLEAHVQSEQHFATEVLRELEDTCLNELFLQETCGRLKLEVAKMEDDLEVMQACHQGALKKLSFTVPQPPPVTSSSSNSGEQDALVMLEKELKVLRRLYTEAKEDAVAARKEHSALLSKSGTVTMPGTPLAASDRGTPLLAASSSGAAACTPPTMVTPRTGYTPPATPDVQPAAPPLPNPFLQSPVGLAPSALPTTSHITATTSGAGATVLSGSEKDLVRVLLSGMETQLAPVLSQLSEVHQAVIHLASSSSLGAAAPQDLQAFPSAASFDWSHVHPQQQQQQPPMHMLLPPAFLANSPLVPPPAAARGADGAGEKDAAVNSPSSASSGIGGGALPPQHQQPQQQHPLAVDKAILDSGAWYRQTSIAESDVLLFSPTLVASDNSAQEARPQKVAPPTPLALGAFAQALLEKIHSAALQQEKIAERLEESQRVHEKRLAEFEKVLLDQQHLPSTSLRAGSGTGDPLVAAAAESNSSSAATEVTNTLASIRHSVRNVLFSTTHNQKIVGDRLDEILKAQQSLQNEMGSIRMLSTSTILGTTTEGPPPLPTTTTASSGGHALPLPLYPPLFTVPPSSSTSTTAAGGGGVVSFVGNPYDPSPVHPQHALHNNSSLSVRSVDGGEGGGRRASHRWDDDDE